MKERHRIGIISDTHGLLRPQVPETLKGCQAILHAGDVGKPEVLHQLKSIAPVYAVRGNADGEWAEALPEELALELYGFRFRMIHDIKNLKEEPMETDMVIYGHSHKYEDRRERTGVRYLNPGSCGPKRFRLPVTMMVLTLCPQKHEAEAERIDLMSGEGRGTAEPEGGEMAEKDMYRLVKKVVKGVRAGKSVSAIAARTHVDEKLVEDICRMYVTHPGVDVDGIMDRLERRGL